MERPWTVTKRSGHEREGLSLNLLWPDIKKDVWGTFKGSLNLIYDISATVYLAALDIKVWRLAF